jgi:hypothetical protein
MIRPTLYTILIAAMLVVALNACSTSPEPRLYIIEPMASSAGTQVNEGLIVTVGPVTLPAHLDHKGIVTHDQRYRVNAAQFDRWAEPLEDNITRVLGENLSVLIASSQVIVYPLRTAHDVDYSVLVRISAFGSDPSGQVVLNADWMIHGATDTPFKVAKSKFSVSRRGNEVIDLVEAMSEAVGQLSRDIASAINAASVNKIQ